MKKYELLKVSGEPDFSLIPVLDIDVPYRDTPSDIGASAQICYGDDAFYVHLWTAEKNPLANEFGPTGMPCRDSCLEFFFSPMEDDERYFNIEFNMNGCVFWGFGSCVDNVIRLAPEDKTPKDTFDYTINRTETGWEIFYSVPYSRIRQFFPDFKVYTGKKMRANCYKCSDMSNPPHYLSWNKIEGERLSFHRPSCFGMMEFM